MSYWSLLGISLGYYKVVLVILTLNEPSFFSVLVFFPQRFASGEVIWAFIHHTIFIAHTENVQDFGIHSSIIKSIYIYNKIMWKLICSYETLDSKLTYHAWIANWLQSRKQHRRYNIDRWSVHGGIADGTTDTFSD